MYVTYPSAQIQGSSQAYIQSVNQDVVISLFYMTPTKILSIFDIDRIQDHPS